MRFIEVAVLGHLQNLARAGCEHVLFGGLLQNFGGIADRRGEHQKQLRRDLIGKPHELRAHLLAGLLGEVRVEQSAQIGEPRAVERERRALQLGLHAAVVRHHDGDEARVVHAQQLEALDGHAAFALGDRVGGIIDDGGCHLPGLRDHAARGGHFVLQCFVDLLRFRLGDLAPLHQLVDIQPVALGGRHAAGGGVRLLEVAQIGQLGKLIAHGGGGNAPAHLLRDGLRADRLGGGNVILDHTLEYLLFACAQLHASDPLS